MDFGATEVVEILNKARADLKAGEQWWLDCSGAGQEVHLSPDQRGY